ncbi:hypothetical protein BVG16_25230 [Paenibacillus selenitireducens]|uniref:DUF5317 domain-containing protein n=1 Tax=Paenibacillus selenitireducens TaxID=1324314 RepID=A0A1T2X2I9_9BACL|nr:DUF5317 domain-containing protein [Paenibacillus selenitireducens]OPA74057.1 hypothetical protein BVG16_25230 [Paenibacillus selenitireducens]
MVIDGIVIGIIVGLIRAGFKNGLVALSNIRIKGGIIFPLLLLLQFFMFYFQDQVQFFNQISGYFFMVVYIVGLYVLWLNRNEPGFWYIFIGVGLNFLVMVLNGGRMPVSLEAAKVLDPIYTQMLKDGVTVTKHIMLDDSTHLSFLGDIIPISSPYPRTQVISIGDIVMNIGIFIYLQKIMLVEKLRTSSVDA